MKKQVKIAIVAGASCGGCDVAIANLHERLLDVVARSDIVFWHTIADFKKEDLEKQRNIDFGIFIGSIRTEEHLELAKILRERCNFLIAFGTCACFGGMFGLGNVAERYELLKVGYITTPSTENPREVIPGNKFEVNGVDLTLPRLTEWCMPLNKVVNVDIFVQGCPPIEEAIDKFYETIIAYADNGVAPERGTVIAGGKTLCDICPREKPEKITIKRFRRVHEGPIDPNKCLLAQGIICLGPITIAACNAACIRANMPCRGCFGPPPDVLDRAAKFISTIASLVEIENEKLLSDEELIKIVEEIEDPLGTFHRFTFPSGLINKKQEDAEE